MRPSWDGFRRYVRSHKNSEVKWVDLIEAGHMTTKLHVYTADAKGELTRKDMLFKFEFEPVDLDRFCAGDEKRLRVAIRERYPFLKIRSSKIRSLASQTPGVEILHHPDNGYDSSMLLKIPDYLQYCTSGKDPRSKKSVAPSAARKTTVSPYFAGKPPSAEPPIVVGDHVRTGVAAASPLAATPVLLTRAGEDPERRRPPRPMIQLLRTAGMCQPLIDYLKSRGVFSTPGRAQWEAIRRWTKSTEGTEWLVACDLDPLGVQVDHIAAKTGLGIGMDSVFNAYFLPSTANAWFGSEDTKAKRAYIGERATKLTKAYHRWVHAKLKNALASDPGMLDQAKFDPVVFN